MALKNKVLAVNTKNFYIAFNLLVFCKLECVIVKMQGKKKPCCSFLIDASKNPAENSHHLSMVFLKVSENSHRILVECFRKVLGIYLKKKYYVQGSYLQVCILQRISTKLHKIHHINTINSHLFTASFLKQK